MKRRKYYKLEGNDIIPREVMYSQNITVQFVQPAELKEVDKDYSHLFGDPFKGKGYDFETILTYLCRVSMQEVVDVQDLWVYSYALVHYSSFYPFDEIEYIYGYTEESYKYGVPLDVFWRYKNK